MKSAVLPAGEVPAHWRIWGASAALLIFALPVAAYAELGGNAATVQADQRHMKGTLRVTTTANYSVHEIQAESGTTVREFVSASGTVFGVAWQGPWAPDMRQLLGSYFDQYVQAVQSKRPRRGAVSVQEPGLVVESGGHMRSFSGRAYLPQMMPPSVEPATIK